ncbi:MAG: hypothetical protein H7A41_05450 [Chlamydiales bacterium]|nr:hypothetical protein [Chlamydiia bacterium]MCP5504583.1 hypothetical protein [Chlamydiales bacterium]
MLYEKLLTEVNEEGISEDTREKKIKQLHEFIKSQSYLHDDHGSAIIGDRQNSPKFEE